MKCFLEHLNLNRTSAHGALRQTTSARLSLAALVLSLALASAAAPSQMAYATGGTVIAWGRNFYGNATIPAGLNSVVAIAAGEFHSLALKSDGTVVAWGDNSSGQTNVPSGLSGVVAIAAGVHHSLALKSDGTVVAWGYNFTGQTDVPAGLSGVTAIAAGYHHSLALKNDGTVVGWGDNYWGQSFVPAGLSGVVAIAAGNFHSLALKSDGTVVGWGQTTIPAGLSGVTAIAAGYLHSLALKSDGTVVAWGANADGEVTIPEGLSNVIAAAVGPNYSLALKSDGTVVAWGLNDYGQTDIPAGLSGLTAIAAGGYHSLAIGVLAPTDTTPPIITPIITGTLGNNGWYVSNVIVSWTVTDAESAIASQTGCDPVTINTDTSGSTPTCSAISAGGPASQSVTVKRDATPPTLAPVVNPNTVTLNGSVIASGGANDALSGLATQSCGTLDTTSIGAKSVTCTATDNAGNTASATASYSVIYAWTGFFQPVDNLPVLNQVKAGAGVAVKFSLGGNQGLNIFAANSPASQQIVCDGGAPVSDIEETVSAGNSSLTYDATTGQYSYTWKTDKGWANTCRQLVVTLADGTQYLANFKFK